MKQIPKILLIFVFLSVASLLFSGCDRMSYEIQTLSINGWNSNENTQTIFVVSNAEINIRKGGDPYTVDFYTKDHEAFIDLIKGHPAFRGESQDGKQRAVYFFCENSNYYFIREGNALSSKKNAYSLDNCTSVYHFNDETVFYFPLYDHWLGHANYIFHNNEIKLETAQDWSFWSEFYSEIGEDYAIISDSEKTIDLKPIIEQNGEKTQAQEFLLKLKYYDENGNKAFMIEKQI
ncbi:MAG: hypothetical protein LBF68_04410 [Christensenellaceae bacterium]|jgi:hypothetical protein|nr:hypothetical protein [Christensenellaceae bacterium]